jgi:hypothetical protein
MNRGLVEVWADKPKHGCKSLFVMSVEISMQTTAVNPFFQ